MAPLAADGRDGLRDRRMTEANHERTLQYLLESATDYAIYMISPDGVVDTWNGGAARLKGYSPS